MDKTEETAAEYLKSRGITNLVYEPDGNVPPDFLVEGHIAVEVRRLNQNEQTPNGHRSLEEVSIPLMHRVKAFLEAEGPSNGESWFVSYHFARPVEPWETLSNALRSVLSDFKGLFGQRTCTLSVLPGFEIQLMKASTPHAHRFVLGGWADLDGGGFVIEELKKNIRLCVEEKTAKVARVRTKYPVWWLLLVDYVAHGIDPEDQVDLRQRLCFDHSWDKVIVVNPLSPDQAFEL